MPIVGLGPDPFGVASVEARPCLLEEPLVGARRGIRRCRRRGPDAVLGLPRGSGFMTEQMDSISLRGVKYCPAPFFPSLAAFSSKPFECRAFDIDVHAVHSSSSIMSTSRLRLTGLLNRGTGLVKISPRMPGAFRACGVLGVVVEEVDAGSGL